MVLDVGRVKHRADLMHKSVGSNGLAVPSNARLAADGQMNVVWTAFDSGSVSFGSNATDITTATAAGASGNAAREDHRHRGVRSITANGSNGLFGNVDLQAGSNIALGVTGQIITITSLASGGSGGGGSGPTDYVSGPSGSGQIIIPGLYGDPDIRVAATNDDEFDVTDTSDPMTGWTTLGAPTHNINSARKSRYYVSSSAAASALQGIYKTVPAIPFTVTCKLTDFTRTTTTAYRAGLLIGEAGGAAKITTFGPANISTLLVTAWTNRTTFSSNPYSDTFQYTPAYLRIIVTLSTSVAFQVSIGGEIWSTVLTGHNPGYTVGIVGLVLNPIGALSEAMFDWIRFT